MKLPFFVGVLLFAAPPAMAGHFSVASLAVDGDVTRVESADFDGDGRNDLLVIYHQKNSTNGKRWAGVFWNHGGSFSAKPDLVLDLAEDVCAFDVAHVLPASKGSQLLEVTTSGVRALSLAPAGPSEPEELLHQTMFFFACDHRDVPRVNVAQKVDDAEPARLFVAGPTTLSIWTDKSKDGSFSRTGTLKLEVPARLSGLSFIKTGTDPGTLAQLNATYSFPSAHVVDANGDGKRDVVVTIKDRVATFFQNADGSFPSSPNVRKTFSVATAAEKEDLEPNVTMNVTDLDGDGVADFVVHKSVQKGLSNATTTHYLYLGRKGGALPDQPDQVITREGYSVTPATVVQVGAQRSLMVPGAQFSVFALIRILTSKSISVSFQFYPFSASSHRFTKEPGYERNLDFHVSLEGITDLQAVDLTGDYNGDGRPDLVFGTSENEVAFYLSDASGKVSSSPVERVKVRGFAEAFPLQLSGGKGSDLVLIAPNSPGHRSQLTVLFNHGGW